MTDLTKQMGLVYRSFSGEVENFTEQHKPLVEVVIAKINEIILKHRIDISEENNYTIKYTNDNTFEVHLTKTHIKDSTVSTNVTVHTVALTDCDDVAFLYTSVKDILSIGGESHVTSIVAMWNQLYLMACSELLLARSSRYHKESELLTNVNTFNINK